MQVIDSPPDHSFWNDDSDKDSAPKRCAEPGCSNPVGETPTGRKAKFCEEHKDAKNRSGNAPKAGPRKARSTWAEKSRVQDALNQLVFFGSAGLQVINKIDGQIVAQGGPAVVQALVDLAEQDKQIRKYLDFLAKPGKYGPLTLAVAGIVIPILANHGLLPKILVDLSGNDSTGSANGKAGGVSE